MFSPQAIILYQLEQFQCRQQCWSLVSLSFKNTLAKFTEKCIKLEHNHILAQNNSVSNTGRDRSIHCEPESCMTLAKVIKALCCSLCRRDQNKTLETLFCLKLHH